jgi:hypothetical protein
MAVLKVIVVFIAKLIGAESEAPGADINSQVKKEKINEGIIYYARNYNMKGNIILFESKDVIL